MVCAVSFLALNVWAPRRVGGWLAIGLSVVAVGCFQADAEDLALLNASGTEKVGDNATATPPAGDAGNERTGPKLFGFACVSPEKGDFHPAGYADSSLHGSEFKTGTSDCRTCHGQKLEGCDFAGGCDNCHDGGHPQGWRTSCTYCHGGETNQTGAPPADLVREKALTDLSFLAHDAHVVGTLHAPYECTECHKKPADLLSPAHVFDDTPGKAEVSFEQGLSKGGSYEGGGSCSNLYCHGNRVKPGAAEHDASLTGCNSCHAYDDAKQLSGRHDAHVNGGLLGFLFEKVACSECHADVIDAAGAIINPALHVNGKVDLTLGEGAVTYDGTRCSGTCHNAPHTIISTWQP